MQPRKRFELGPSDLLAGIAYCLRRPDRAALRRRLERRWLDGDPDPAYPPESAKPAKERAVPAGLACLSVRSALDLYLAARAFPARSEILMTGANVPDMARVVEAHGLVPVAVDFDLAELAPTLDAIEAHRSPRSRALVFAHLFGAAVPLDAVAAHCRRHGLDLVEDCAQAFCGPDYRGHPGATLSLFSFGPIKSATALAGALASVRDAELERRMRRAGAAWPLAGDAAYLRRLGKYAGLSLLTLPTVYGLLARAVRLGRRDLDAWVRGAARSFAGDRLMGQIRRRPGGALLALLDRQQRRCGTDHYQRRAEAGRWLAAELAGAVTVPGGDHPQDLLEHHTFWVFPVLADDPGGLVRALRRADFDATRHATLAPLAAGLPRLEADFRRLVYLPFDVRMPRRQLRRMAAVVHRHAEVAVR